MVQVYHLQKAHPDVGEFRIWSLLARPDISVRTIGRVMALNRLVYDDIPHVPKKGVPRVPGPHPYKAEAPHQFWFIDGRQMDFALGGHKWWSIVVLEGYSRTILAGAMAPTEATWVALMVLYTACVRYGAPETSVSDSGGAYTSNDFEAVCTRLQIHHETIVSTQGESYQNLMETHFNIQRRLYDYQFSLARTPAALEQVIRSSSRPTIRPPIKGSCTISDFLRSRSKSWGRRRADSILRTSWPAASPMRCSRASPTDMGVSPSTAIISTSKRGYPRRRCCYGCRVSTCERSLTTCCWRNITATTIGGTTKSKRSVRRCFTPRALPRHSSRCCR